jgi:molybdopterin synthase catalytic subunit
VESGKRNLRERPKLSNWACRRYPALLTLITQNTQPTMIHLTDQPIDTAALIDQARTPEAGAVVVFLGITRQFTAGSKNAGEDLTGDRIAGDGEGVRETSMLQYDAYREMAEQEIAKLVTEANRRWSLVECLIVHRLGTVPIAEVSVAIVVSSAHRRAALAAGEWLIDTLKDRVPIWKKECWADGQTDWVHPLPKER